MRIQYKIQGWTSLPEKYNLENDFSVKYSKNLEKHLNQWLKYLKYKYFDSECS